MENYIFFIGGSGARVYKAFIHSASAGMIKTKKVSTLLVDADKSNDANTSCKALYNEYIKIRGLFEGMESDMFSCDIHMESENVLSPVKSDANTLGAAVGSTDKDRESLLKAFYTKEEIEQPLDGGFYSHPNIGCVFFSDFDNEEFNTCLQKIQSQLDSGNEVMIALVGSIFGGTGAAGIPTLFKLIYNKFKTHGNFTKLHVGGVFLEPYFKVNGKRDSNNKNMAINMEEFYFNTYEALAYYQTNGNMNFHSIYLLGQQTLDVVNSKYADSGSAQNNKAHIIEIYASLAIDRFFCYLQEKGVFGYVGEGGLGWNSFPMPENNNNITAAWKLADFTRMQAIQIAEIYNYINSNDRKWFKEIGIMVPQWYKVYKVDDANEKEQMKVIQQYSIQFIEWMYMINSAYDEENNLILNPKMNLCGDALKNVYNISLSISGKKQFSNKEEKDNINSFRDKFNTLIDTTSNIEYVLDKVGDILSLTSAFSGTAPVAGAVGLFMKVASLVCKQKNKN